MRCCCFAQRMSSEAWSSGWRCWTLRCRRGREQMFHLFAGRQRIQTRHATLGGRESSKQLESYDSLSSVLILLALDVAWLAAGSHRSQLSESFRASSRFSRHDGVRVRGNSRRGGALQPAAAGSLAAEPHPTARREHRKSHQPLSYTRRRRRRISSATTAAAISTAASTAITSSTAAIPAAAVCQRLANIVHRRT